MIKQSRDFLIKRYILLKYIKVFLIKRYNILINFELFSYGIESKYLVKSKNIFNIHLMLHKLLKMYMLAYLLFITSLNMLLPQNYGLAN